MGFLNVCLFFKATKTFLCMLFHGLFQWFFIGVLLNILVFNVFFRFFFCIFCYF